MVLEQANTVLLHALPWALEGEQVSARVHGPRLQEAPCASCGGAGSGGFPKGGAREAEHGDERSGDAGRGQMSLQESSAPRQ